MFPAECTKGDTELLRLHAICAYNAQKKKEEKGVYSVFRELSNEPKMKIVPKKFVEIQPGV